MHSFWGVVKKFWLAKMALNKINLVSHSRLLWTTVAMATSSKECALGIDLQHGNSRQTICLSATYTVIDFCIFVY